MLTGWTTADIPDLSGCTAVVTGANSGIGLQIAAALAGAGARVIMACRNLDKAADAAESIAGDVVVRELDLADLGSIRKFCASVDEPIALLINNAGVFSATRRTTADGFELQFGTNHLGHFALTGLLLECLTDRVVTVSSVTHAHAKIRAAEPRRRRVIPGTGAYAESKLANLMFALQLERRLAAVDAGLSSMAAHPGYVATNLITRLGPVAKVVATGINAVAAQTAEQGAWPVLYAATEPDLPGGCYIGPDGLGELRGHPRAASISRRAQDPDAQQALWERSEGLTGVRYDFAALAR